MSVSTLVVDGGMVVVVGRERFGLLLTPNRALAFADARNLASFQERDALRMYSINYQRIITLPWCNW